MSDDQRGIGVPVGNTVAVVGDPGTGKTTLLLDLVRSAHCRERGLLRLDRRNDAEGPLTELTRLVRRTRDGEAVTTRTLRCFISIESSFGRMWTTNRQLLENPVKGTDDLYFFIDASAFLSGRAEDRLRYPRLGELCVDHEWNAYDLSLGGHGVDDAEFGLYWQRPQREPKRIEHLSSGPDPDVGHPFLPLDDQPSRHRLITLLTAPLLDPERRVRLVKDVLAEIFIRFKEDEGEADTTTRVVAIDSLSALITRLGSDGNAFDGDDGARLPILNLVRWLEDNRATTFLASEAERTQAATLSDELLFLGAAERYLVSAIIQLNYHRYPSRDVVRYLQILKMRGAAHDPRPFAYGLNANGLDWLELLFSSMPTEGRG
jgi:KaiC/GvpD/RAD55 family RecA-like ATPase